MPKQEQSHLSCSQNIKIHKVIHWIGHASYTISKWNKNPLVKCIRLNWCIWNGIPYRLNSAKCSCNRFSIKRWTYILFYHFWIAHFLVIFSILSLKAHHAKILVRFAYDLRVYVLEMILDFIFGSVWHFVSLIGYFIYFCHWCNWNVFCLSKSDQDLWCVNFE